MKRFLFILLVGFVVLFFACDGGSGTEGNDPNSYSTQDNIAPVITDFTLITSNPTANSTISFTIIASDNNNEIDGYLITETSNKPSPNDSEVPIGHWQFPKPTYYTFLNNNYEIKNVYLWVRDKDNNVSESAHI